MNNNAFKYTKTARPTTYKGRNFRSELEAAWAAFFDIRSIAYDYEPLVDLVAWRPDFHITLKQNDFVLAEVKPYFNLDQWQNDTATLSKIQDSFSAGFWVVLLGASPLMQATFMFGINPDPNDPDPRFDPLDFGESDITQEDWNRAKNTVMWRP